MKILLTGSCGFIGSNLAHYLVNKGHDIVIVDKITYAGNIRNSPNNSILEISDISNYDSFYDIVERHNPELIINLAASSHVDRSIHESKEFVHSNIVGTHSVLETCRQQNIPLIQIGSDEEYGHILEGSFTEESKCRPRNPYSSSKNASTALALSYYETYGLNVIVTRSCNVYGIRQHEEKFIPKIITNALQNKKIPVYGDGENVRDWLYVEDICKSLELLVENGISGEIYNISGRNEQKNIDVVKKILKIMNKPEHLIEFVQDRKSHDIRYSSIDDKIRNLGWKPEVDFDEGLKRTIEYYTEMTK